MIVALISTSGVLGAAWISSRERDSVSTAESPARAPIPLAVVAKDQSPLAITGVRTGGAVGRLGEPHTQFNQNDVIAVRVEYRAASRVASFPARLTARVSAVSIGWGDVEETADISTPGENVRTFRLLPADGKSWSPGKHVISIQVDGREAYRQILDVTAN